jgi:hypothetical protein
MTIERIHELRTELENETISHGELAEIEAAFNQLPDDVLRDERENALAADMLDELEDNL